MPFGIGELPKEYNLKVHGPYDPAVYYGPKDTPLGQVKVKELPGWLARRGKSPVAMGRACSRAYWRWCHKYVFPTRSGHLNSILFVFSNQRIQAEKVFSAKIPSGFVTVVLRVSWD